MSQLQNRWDNNCSDFAFSIGGFDKLYRECSLCEEVCHKRNGSRDTEEILRLKTSGSCIGGELPRRRGCDGSIGNCPIDPAKETHHSLSPKSRTIYVETLWNCFEKQMINTIDSNCEERNLLLDWSWKWTGRCACFHHTKTTRINTKVSLKANILHTDQSWVMVHGGNYAMFSMAGQESCSVRARQCDRNCAAQCEPSH